MTLKPVIANPEIEFDARELAGVPTVDWAQATTWPDTSGQGNDATGAGVSRRYEREGFGGTSPDVRCEHGAQEGWTFSGTALNTTRHTAFIVIQAIDISNHLAIWGSDVSSGPGPRFIQLFAKSDGALVYNRSLDTYDIESATGVIVNGGKYVITIKVDATDGMVLRVNGVQVGINGGETAANLAFSGPTRIGRINDQNTGGVGAIFGDKRYKWVSFHSTDISDADILLMERWLGGQYGISIPGGSNDVKPTLASQEGEYDIASYSSQDDGDAVGTWTDTSGNANNATVVGTPEYEAGAWSPGQEAVRFTGSGLFNFDGTAFAGEDAITVFMVFNTQDLTNREVLIGGSSLVDRRMLMSFVEPNGEINFSFGTNQGITLAANSASGEIVADGTCYVITFQHTNSGGKIIRKAVTGDGTGSQIASNASATLNLLAWDSARIADVAGFLPNQYMKLAWFSGHLTEASLAQMEQMETWLLETFCGQALPATGFPRASQPGVTGYIRSPGVLIRKSNSGIIEIRGAKALGWSWEETWGLMNVRDADDMAVMTFVKNAWHKGLTFEAVNRLVPGSGMSPNGLGTLGILVQGSGQLGSSVTTDGWPSSTVQVSRAGDVIKIVNDDAVYMLTADADSDGSGVAVLHISPNLRVSPANNAAVKTVNVSFTVAIMSASRFDGARAPQYYAGLTVRFAESLL